MTEERQEITISIQEAGRRYFGLAKNASYRAAASGSIPALKIGGVWRVPVKALDAMLERPTGKAA